MPEQPFEWTKKQIKEAGLEIAAVYNLVADLENLVQGLDRAGLGVYVASGLICLHLQGKPPHLDQANTIASIPSHGTFDGGDV